MKAFVNISRLVVGCLFIFSGLVKAIDPLGLAYKMQEFFEAWANAGIFKGLMGWLNGQALLFSIVMITLEVILGVVLLLGWKKKMVNWLLLLLMLFFTFLTSYVLFSGKIRACGCFGDCIPLTPVQTFTKDIVLLLLVLLLLFGSKYINPLFSNKINTGIFLISLLAVLALQWYVLKHLPVKDCLPFKAGNNILELRKMPKDAVPDKFDYKFVYKKNGEQKEFGMSELPDSTWEFVDRKQVLIAKGKNNMPLINDFILKTGAQNDTTEALLQTAGEYYLLFVKDATEISGSQDADLQFVKATAGTGKKVFVIASERNKTEARYAALSASGKTITVPVLTCDATALKTAARNNVTLYRMEGPVVKQKWGGSDIEKAIMK